jgi:predicted acylesterase/phospholipase RssA
VFTPLVGGLKAGLLGLLVLLIPGCKSLYSHANRPWVESRVWPDCRATAEIQQPRGADDVMVILCLSGGGSRAAWFSAATMLRLERVVEEINLLHEVDVISSVSGAGLPAAYYCLTRDPGPYSVVRVKALPEQLPPDLTKTVKMDRQHGLIGVSGKMTPEQRDLLRVIFTNSDDQASVERLFWLSHHTRAPAVWEPEVVRNLMTRDYISKLVVAITVPRWRYWFTAYDRSDMMATIFARHVFGTKCVEIPKPLRDVAALGFLGGLDRPARDAANLEVARAAEKGEADLRWPKAERVQGPLRLDWIPGYTPMRQGAQFVAGDVAVGGVQRISQNFQRVVPYRYKDLNPERPYLILNTTNGTEDDADEPHYGEVFPFTREQFKRQLDSNIDDYPIAWGVMASAAFPGVFSYVTLKDYRSTGKKSPARYMHVFDGGNSDNLGLTSAKRIILNNRDRYRHFVVLLVDSHTSARGAARHEPDVRNRVVDKNFVSSFGTLLDSLRQHEVDEFAAGVLDGQVLKDKMTFWHLNFDQVRDEQTRVKANKIPTTFKISGENVEVIDRCVMDLIRPDQPKLQEILRVLRVVPKSATNSSTVVHAAPAP